MWLDICTWLIPIPVFCHWTDRIKRCIFHVVFQDRFIGYYGDILIGSSWYSTMNFTMMLWFFVYLCIKGIIFLVSSILSTLLTVVILWRLLKLHLLFCRIILVGTGLLPWTPIMLWIIFKIAECLTLYKNTRKIK